MEIKRSTEVKVGAVSIVALILLFAGIMLGKGYKEHISSSTIKIRLVNTGGLQPSSPVYVNGVKRGSVKSLTNDNGSVIVAVSIDNTQDFRKDVFAKVYILEITGGKKVEISPGISPEPFNPNNEIPGLPTSDLSILVASLGEVSEDAKNLVRRLDTISLAGTKFLNNDKMMNQLENTVNNTSEIIASIRILIDNNKTGLESTLKDLKIIAQDVKFALNKYEPRVDTITNQLNITLNQANKAIKKVDTTISIANNILRDLDDISKEVKNGNGLANRIIYDKQLAMQLDSTLNELSTLVKTINQHGVNVNLRLGTRP